MNSKQLSSENIKFNSNEIKETELQIFGMTCSNCALKVEKSLNDLATVSAVVNFATSKAIVRYDSLVTHPDEFISQIQGIGYQVINVNEDSSGLKNNEIVYEEQKKELQLFIISAILTFPFLIEMYLMFMSPESHGFIPRWIQFMLAFPVQFVVGWKFYRGAFFSLKGRVANMDVLVALGTSMAFILSAIVTFFNWHDQHVYFEASTMIITLILAGKILEARAKNKTSEALESLIKLQPQKAFVERNERIEEVEINDVIINDIVIVKSAESIPVDGIVIDGVSSVDESMLTGESQLVKKSINDKVFAATINQNGLLKIKALGVGNKTQLAQIVKIVSSAQGSKAPIQKLTDKISSIFVPIIILISLMTFVISWLVLGEIAQAFVSAVSVLVIACPCALGLATPTAVIVSIGRAAQNGILFRDARAIEAAGKIDTLVLDKTGTITEGKPRLIDLKILNDFTVDLVLGLASSLEQGSTHPLASAIVEAGKLKNVELSAVENFETLPGYGVSGIINGKKYFIGKPEWISQNGQININSAQNFSNDGQSIVVLFSENEIIAYISISDEIRTSSFDAIRKIIKNGIRVFMLTGDNETTARMVAKKVGITEFKHNVLPLDKASQIVALRRQKLNVAMVGDGINDAPALALADVSFSMSSGTDIAIKAADVTLMNNDLNSVFLAIVLSKKTIKKIRQNLFFAFIYNILGIPLAAFGLLNPSIAGGAMALSSVTVILNSLMLKKEGID